MTGVRVADPLARRVVLGDEQRRHVGVGQRAEVRVEPLEHRGRGEPVERAVLQDVAQLAHRRGGPHPVADDVADDEHHAAVAQRHRVVPVATDLQPDAARDVAGREVGVLEHRAAAPGSRLRCSASAVASSRSNRIASSTAGATRPRDLPRQREVLDARSAGRSRA